MEVQTIEVLSQIFPSGNKSKTMTQNNPTLKNHKNWSQNQKFLIPRSSYLMV